jgi:hypothetical protein
MYSLQESKSGGDRTLDTMLLNCTFPKNLFLKSVNWHQNSGFKRRETTELSKFVLIDLDVVQGSYRPQLSKHGLSIRCLTLPFFGDLKFRLFFASLIRTDECFLGCLGWIVVKSFLSILCSVLQMLGLISSVRRPKVHPVMVRGNAHCWGSIEHYYRQPQPLSD